MQKEVLENMRKNYMLASLNEEDVAINPFDQFKKWFNEALESKIYEPNAMVVSSVDEHQKPSSRVVLLKGISHNGIVFYTNFKSRKGKELSMNPNCSVVFLWGELERQVRLEGVVSPMLYEESEAYFKTRPRESQISASVSPQSTSIKDKAILEKEWEVLSDKLIDKEVPMPEHWGGYEIEVNYFEFWQGRPGRFHDRIVFSIVENQWKISRLAP